MSKAGTLILAALLLSPLARPGAADQPTSAASAEDSVRRLRAQDVFDYGRRVIFQDDFRSGQFGKWKFSEDDNYRIPKPNLDRIRIVDAPALGANRKAVRFAVAREPNLFRSEISLPHESGFQERWYGERIFIPQDWVFDAMRGNDIVMQWHAIPGNWRATYPNLAISIGNANWFIRQSYGSAQTKPTRTSLKLDDPVQRGTWVSWVIHAKWSPGDGGILQIWKDGKLVVDRKGANVYSTIGVDYTPYLKTGIYRPEWHLDRPDKKEAFDKENPSATNKVIYVTDIKVGDDRATYEDMAPALGKRPAEYRCTGGGRREVGTGPARCGEGYCWAFQDSGSSSARRVEGWEAMRVSRSRRYSKGLTWWRSQVAMRLNSTAAVVPPLSEPRNVSVP